LSSLEAKLSTDDQISSADNQNVAERLLLLVNKQANAQAPLASRVSTLNAKETDDGHELFDRLNIYIYFFYIGTIYIYIYLFILKCIY